MSALDMVIWYTGIAVEVVLIGIVWKRGVGKRLPVFAAYLAWGIITDVAMLVVWERLRGYYPQVFRIESSLDACLQFLVLFELARLAFRYLPTIVSRGILSLFLVLTVGAGWGVWRITNWWIPRGFSADGHTLWHEQIAASLLRIFFLLALGWLIQFLNRHFIPVGWAERELQVATGFGFYSLGSLATCLGHTNNLPPTVYHLLDNVATLSFLGVLAYWLVSFLRPERPVNEPAHVSGPAGSRPQAADQTVDRRGLSVAIKA